MFCSHSFLLTSKGRPVFIYTIHLTEACSTGVNDTSIGLKWSWGENTGRVSFLWILAHSVPCTQTALLFLLYITNSCSFSQTQLRYCLSNDFFPCLWGKESMSLQKPMCVLPQALWAPFSPLHSPASPQGHHEQSERAKF